MKTLKVGLFSNMKFCLVVAAAVVSVCLWAGCTSVPQKYKAYAGRNPKTGEPTRVKPKKLPFFKCGKKLKDRVNV